MSEHASVARRACPRAKAHPAGFETIPHLALLPLSGLSIRRKRHESVISIVMGSGPKRSFPKNDIIGKLLAVTARRLRGSFLWDEEAGWAAHRQHSQPPHPKLCAKTTPLDEFPPDITPPTG